MTRILAIISLTVPWLSQLHKQSVLDTVYCSTSTAPDLSYRSSYHLISSAPGWQSLIDCHCHLTDTVRQDSLYRCDSCSCGRCDSLHRQHIQTGQPILTKQTNSQYRRNSCSWADGTDYIDGIVIVKVISGTDGTVCMSRLHRYAKML